MDIVQMVDNTMQWITCYPMDIKCSDSVLCYPSDKDLSIGIMHYLLLEQWWPEMHGEPQHSKL